MSKAVIQFSNLGLAPQFWGDRNRAISEPASRLEDTKYPGFADGIFNPFRRTGFLSPANQSYKRITAAGDQSVYGSVPRVFLQFSVVDPQISYLLAGVRLWSGSDDNFTSLTSDSHAIGSGSDVYPLDLAQYYLNGSSVYPYYLTGFASATYGALGYYDSSGPTYTNVKTGLVNIDEYSSLVLADNGYLYVLLSNYVDKWDGTSFGGSSGIYTQGVLLFPSSIKTRGGIDFRGNMHIGIVGFESSTYRGGSYRNNTITKTQTQRYVGVYIWDRLSTTTRMRDFIQIPAMQNLVGFHISPQMKARVFGMTTNRTTQLLEFDGTRYNSIVELGPLAYPAQPKGVCTSGMITYWLGQDGFFYAYGRSNPTGTDVLVKLLDVNAVAAAISGVPTDVMTMAGAVLQNGYYNTGQVDTNDRLDYESFLIGFTRTGGVNEVIRYFPHTTEILQSVTPVANVGNVYSSVKRLPVFSTLNYIRLYNLPTTTVGTSTIATIRVYYNHSSTASEVVTVSQKEAVLGYKYIACNKPDIYAVQVEVSFGTSAQLGNDDFSPIYAELDYTEKTMTKSGKPGKQR